MVLRLNWVHVIRLFTLYFASICYQGPLNPLPTFNQTGPQPGSHPLITPSPLNHGTTTQPYHYHSTTPSPLNHVTITQQYHYHSTMSVMSLILTNTNPNITSLKHSPAMGNHNPALGHFMVGLTTDVNILMRYPHWISSECVDIQEVCISEISSLDIFRVCRYPGSVC